MSKNIKDYLHLYLGAKFRYRYVDYTKDEWTVWIELTPIRYMQIMEDASIDGIQIQCRPLSSMTEDELLESANILGGNSHLSDEVKIYEAKELLTTNRIYNMQTNIPGIKWMQLTHYLLSKHFDLFGLIESGLALDSSTHNK